MDDVARLEELREDYFRAEKHPWDADAVSIRDLIDIIDRARVSHRQLLLEFGKHKSQCAHLRGGRCDCGLSLALSKLGHVDPDFEDGWG